MPTGRRSILQAKLRHGGRQYVVLFQPPERMQGARAYFYDCSVREVVRGEQLATFACKFTRARGCFGIEPVLVARKDPSWTKRQIEDFAQAVARCFGRARAIEWKHGPDCNGRCDVCKGVRAENKRVRAEVEARRSRHVAQGYEVEEVA
jgi:hypothetical protein